MLKNPLCYSKTKYANALIDNPRYSAYTVNSSTSEGPNKPEDLRVKSEKYVRP